MSVDLVSSEEASTHSAPSFSCSTQEAEVPHKLTAEQLPGEKKKNRKPAERDSNQHPVGYTPQINGHYFPLSVGLCCVLMRSPDDWVQWNVLAQDSRPRVGSP